MTKMPIMYRQQKSAVAIAMVTMIVLNVSGVEASSWSPAVLVNTEAFQILDSGDGNVDIELRFGDTLNEKLYWNQSLSRFQVTDDLHVEGNLTGSGTLAIESNVRTKADLTINSDDGGVDAILTFGNNGGAETLRFSDSIERFEFSDDMHATGNIAGSGTLAITGNAKFNSTLTINGLTYTFPSGGQSNGYVLTTNGAGALTWEEDDTGAGGGLTTADADVRYVNIAGDTMTGALVISTGNGLTASGTIQTEGNMGINKDNAGADAILTFGNNGGAETLRFSDSTERFEFSDDAHLTGTLQGSGSLRIENSVNVKGDININYLNGATAAIINFGNNDGGEQLVFSDDNNRFEITDDFFVGGTGDVAASGSLIVDSNIGTKADLTINSDNGGVDAILTFGNNAGAETLRFSDSTERFEFTDDLHATGALTASGAMIVDGTTKLNKVTYTWPSVTASASGKVLSINPASGQLSWKTDASGSGPSTVVSTANTSDNATGGTNNVTGLSIAVSASTNYIIRCLLTTNSATTTTGVQITVNGPASPSQVTWQRQSCSSTTALVNANINAFGTEDARTASAGTTRCVEPINIHLRNGANAGNVTFSVDTEIASSAVTVYTGSFCDYQTY